MLAHRSALLNTLSCLRIHITVQVRWGWRERSIYSTSRVCLSYFDGYRPILIPARLDAMSYGT